MSIDGVTKGRWFISAAALAGLLAGGLLIYAAVPRIAAHAIVLRAGPDIRAIDEGRSISGEAAETAYGKYTEALLWRPSDPALLRGKARLAGRLAFLKPGSSGLWRERAVADLRAAVAAAPGDGTAWAWLAQAELNAGGSVEEVLPHLRLARLTAPRRASALLPQFAIVMKHWSAMPDEMRAHALSNLPAFWSRRTLRPWLMATYIEAGLPARAAFREQLGKNEKMLRDFDRVLTSSLGL